MADYRVFETASFREDLDAVTAFERTRLLAKLNGYVYPQMRLDPRGHPQGRVLRNMRPETWRWRIGDWRVFFQIDDTENLVLIVALAQRKDAY